jgi:hypothetical protein
LLVIGATALVVATTRAHAQQSTAPREEAGSHWTPFPAGRLFPTAIADPTAPGVGVSALGVTELGVEDAGDVRVMLQLGGQFGVVRWQPRAEAGWTLQLGIDGGFNGQFDATRKTDNIGWDGLYGVTVSAASPHGLVLRFGTMHTSSHVGDEYIERTGRERIGYTRQELLLGVSWPATRTLRLYAEVGGAVHLLNDELQQPWRVQAGAEFLKPGWPFRDRGGWYAAVDAGSWEERDWAVDLSAQLGLFYPAGDRRWRTGIGFHSGRVPIGEFFQDTETYWSLGLYIDL